MIDGLTCQIRARYSGHKEMQMIKIAKRIGLGLLALFVLAMIGGDYKLRASGQPQIDGSMHLAGLTAPVTVTRDELGTPYIFASNTPDLIRAQGFVTAQDRLMQMELFLSLIHISEPTRQAE